MPVLLGEANARLVAQGLMIAFYPIVLGAAARRLDRAVGRARGARASRGSSRCCEVFGEAAGRRSTPHSYVGWPLWFVGQAFVHTRRAGALLILGPAAERVPAGRAALGLIRGPGAGSRRSRRDARRQLTQQAVGSEADLAGLEPTGDPPRLPGCRGGLAGPAEGEQAASLAQP